MKQKSHRAWLIDGALKPVPKAPDRVKPASRSQAAEMRPVVSDPKSSVSSQRRPPVRLNRSPKSNRATPKTEVVPRSAVVPSDRLPSVSSRSAPKA